MPPWHTGYDGSFLMNPHCNRKLKLIFSKMAKRSLLWRLETKVPGEKGKRKVILLNLNIFNFRTCETETCEELNTRPDESCRLWRVVVCDLETQRMRRPWVASDRSATGIKRKPYLVLTELQSKFRRPNYSCRDCPIIIIITTENGHIGHCTHTSESTNVKVQ